MRKPLRFRLVVRPRFLRSPLVVAQVIELYNNADPADPRDSGQSWMRWRDATPADVANYLGDTA